MVQPKVEYHSVLKTQELSSHEKQGNLKGILLSERSKSEKATYCLIPTTWHSGKDKTMEALKRSAGYQGLGVGGMNEKIAEYF